MFSVPPKITHAPTTALESPASGDDPVTGAPHCKKTLWHQLTTVTSERSGNSLPKTTSFPKTCILHSSAGAAAMGEAGLLYHFCGGFICSLARIPLPCSQLTVRQAHRAALWGYITYWWKRGIEMKQPRRTKKKQWMDKVRLYETNPDHTISI